MTAVIAAIKKTSPLPIGLVFFIATIYILVSLTAKKPAPAGLAQYSYGRGSWTRTNACGIQRPVPYQLGDTPVSFDIYILYG